MDRSSFLVASGAASLVLSRPALAQGAGTPLTVELGDVSSTKVPFIVAADAGIYARNGLDVTQFITPGAAAAAGQSGLAVPPEFVRSDLVGDINIGGGSPTIVRMTSVATAPQRIILATNDPVGGFHVFARSGIAHVRDLKGKRIGYGSAGALDHLLLNAMAQRFGWDAQRDWSMLSNVNGPDAAAKTHVDAFLSAPLARTEAQKVGFHDIADVNAFKFTILGSGVNALKSWLPANRTTAAAFVKSTVEAIALVKRDRAAAFVAMTKWYGLSDPVRQQALYEQAAGMPGKPYPSVAGLRLVRSIYTWRDMQIHPASYFLDPSFIAALDKSGYIDSLYKRGAA